MDLLRIFLLFTISLSTAAINPVPHEDLLQQPPVYRSCIEAQCPCGTEPRICDVENGEAYCVPCEEGRFQAERISSQTIIHARRCTPHKQCSKGWFIYLDI